MTSEFDQIVENHFEEKRDVFGFDSIAKLIEEVMDARTLEEAQDSVQKRAEQFLLVLPKFTPTEAWGNPNSMERQQINRLFAVMGGGRTIKGKLGFLQRMADPKNKITSPRRIISSLIILESLSAVVTSFNAASAGFVFEGFLAALLEGEQITDMSAKGNLPIQDLIAFTPREEEEGPGRPISLKLLGPKTNIEGSYTNLVDGLGEFGEMIYIVARKVPAAEAPTADKAPAEVIAIEQFRFTQDNFIDALYLDAKGKGKAKGLRLFELPGKTAEDSIKILKRQPTWEEKYDLLQQTSGYSQRIKKARADRLAAAAEAEKAAASAEAEQTAQSAEADPAPEVAATRGAADQVQAALHEMIREEWSLLLEEKGGTQWTISAPQLKTFDFVEYVTLGILPFSAEQIRNVAVMHMDKLNGDLFNLFGATKALSENINKYFTFDKRDRAISSGERAIENTAQIEQALTKGITATAAEPEIPEK